jgi:hypothetical protein
MGPPVESVLERVGILVFAQPLLPVGMGPHVLKAQATHHGLMPCEAASVFLGARSRLCSSMIRLSFSWRHIAILSGRSHAANSPWAMYGAAGRVTGFVMDDGSNPAPQVFAKVQPNPDQ